MKVSSKKIEILNKVIELDGSFFKKSKYPLTKYQLRKQLGNNGYVAELIQELISEQVLVLAKDDKYKLSKKHLKNVLRKTEVYSLFKKVYDVLD